MKHLNYALIIILLLLFSGCSGDQAYVIVENTDNIDVNIASVTENVSIDVNVEEISDNASIRVEGRTSNTTYQVPWVDSATHALLVIDVEHYEIHEGATFTVLNVVDLGNAEVRDILIVTPDTAKWAHLVWEIEHELETKIQFYNNTTVTNNGTAIQAINRNGNSTENSTTLVFHTPNITNVGDLLGTIQQGDGKKAGGSDREANEFILKQDCAYLVRITNLTVNNNLIFTKLNWYELARRGP